MMKSYRLVVLIGAFGLIVTLLGESPGPAVMSLSQDAQAVSLPDGASTGWWAAVQDNIRESEYHVTWQDHTYLPDLAAAYQTPNRAHNLRTYFAPDGVRLCRVEPEQETSAYDQGQWPPVRRDSQRPVPGFFQLPSFHLLRQSG